MVYFLYPLCVLYPLVSIRVTLMNAAANRTHRPHQCRCREYVNYLQEFPEPVCSKIVPCIMCNHAAVGEFGKHEARLLSMQGRLCELHVLSALEACERGETAQAFFEFAAKLHTQRINYATQESNRRLPKSEECDVTPVPIPVDRPPRVHVFDPERMQFLKSKKEADPKAFDEFVRTELATAYNAGRIPAHIYLAEREPEKWPDKWRQTEI